jgi:hypothetical protein
VKAGTDAVLEKDGSAENPVATLAEAYTMALATGNEDIRRIVVLSDLSEQDVVTLTGNGGDTKEVVIEGRYPGYKIQRTAGTGSGNDSVFHIENNAKIRFENIEVNGIYGDEVFNRAIRVYGYSNAGMSSADAEKVQNGGTQTTVVTLGNGAVLTGKTQNGENAGGILLSDQAKLIMEDGSTIIGCFSGVAGAVQVYNSVFVMDGGLITTNTAVKTGGGVQVMGGKFELNGGDIINNVVTTGNGNRGGGGIFAEESYYSIPSTFTMNGGMVSDNTVENGGGGGGIGIWEGTFTMNAGVISGNSSNDNDGKTVAGGVYLFDATKSVFTMTGGVIYGSDAGAGVENTVTSTGSKGAALYKGQQAVIQNSNPAKIGNLTGQTLNEESGLQNNTDKVKTINDTIDMRP